MRMRFHTDKMHQPCLDLQPKQHDAEFMDQVEREGDLAQVLTEARLEECF